MAGGGISWGGRTELLAPGSSIFCRCGWSRRVRRFPLARVRLLVTELPPAAVKREMGQLLVGVARLIAVVGFERLLDEPFVDLVGLG